jgi:hypothetical protein
MPQARDALTDTRAERLCGAVAHRDEGRVARRRSRTQVVDEVYRLNAGAGLDACFHFLDTSGVMALLSDVHGTAIQRERVPFVPYVLRDRLKTLFGMESIKALPALLCSAAALMPWVGFKAQHVRQGGCPRGAVKRQGKRAPGPICPDPLAKHLVKWKVRALEAVGQGAIRAWAKAGVFGAKVTGSVDGTDVETTARDKSWGQVTRPVRLEDQQGRVPEIEVPVAGGKVLLRLDAATKRPLAVKGGKRHAHEALWTRALVTPARLNLAGTARRHKGVFEKGVVDGSTWWWLDQPGISCVVPAQAKMAVVADARAQAVAGEDRTVGCRVHTRRHGQGNAAGTARLVTEVVGITGLTTDDQYGTPEHGRPQHRRDCQAHPSNAVVVRQWQGKDEGSGGQTVFRTNASGEQPLPPCDDDDDRRLIENGGLKEATQPWNLGHPPPNTERAVRRHVLFTLLLCALATGDRLPCAREARGGDPVGWQGWRRQLLEQTREQVMVFAPGDEGIFHLAQDSLLVGVKRKDVPPGLGTRQDILAK